MTHEKSLHVAQQTLTALAQAASDCPNLQYATEYAQFIGSAAYDGEGDLIVVSPDGRGASACTIWFDLINGVGLFEPAGTHPNFQDQGLSKAVMAEGMHHMRSS